MKLNMIERILRIITDFHWDSFGLYYFFGTSHVFMIVDVGLKVLCDEISFHYIRFFILSESFFGINFATMKIL